MQKRAGIAGGGAVSRSRCMVYSQCKRELVKLVVVLLAGPGAWCSQCKRELLATGVSTDSVISYGRYSSAEFSCGCC